MAHPTLRRLAESIAWPQVAQEIEQHHGAAFSVIHLVDRLQTGKGPFGDAHAVAMGEQGDWVGLLCGLALARGGDQGVIDPRGPAAGSTNSLTPTVERIGLQLCPCPVVSSRTNK